LTEPAAEPAERKQRRTTSDRINPNSPAYKVVHGKGGGLSKFCADFDFPTSTVQSWLERGLIPSRTRHSEELGRTVSYQAYIIARGKQLDPPVDYVPEDFIESEEAYL
jgi:hypothetical protein